jgi:shikimate dehydrogenase
MSDISATTKVCAVIGDPVEHSLSPQIHNAAFRARGLDFCYVAFPVRKGATAKAMEGVRGLGIRGLSVTIPHKVEIIPHLDKVDRVALDIGSVNTVVNDGGELVGHSTDGPGAIRALEARDVEPQGKQVLLLGSGGAARAIAFSLASLNPPSALTILGIEQAELEQLTGDLQERTTMEVCSTLLKQDSLKQAVKAAEIIVHCTPVGMTPNVDDSLVSADLLRPDQVVFDVVYNPFETSLLKAARQAGARTVPGLGMFVQQAAIQFELWTETEAPVKAMVKATQEALAGAA